MALGVSDRDDSDGFDWDSDDSDGSDGFDWDNDDSDGSDGFDWDNDNGESVSAGDQKWKEMGFTDEVIQKAKEDNGDNREDTLIHLLLIYEAQRNQPNVNVGTNIASSLDSSTKELYQNLDKAAGTLLDMGFSTSQVDLAIASHGKDASIDELAISIIESQTRGDGYHGNLVENRKKRKRYGGQAQGSRGPLDGRFAERGQCSRQVHRSLRPNAIGPPFFYYENSSHARKDVWSVISEQLYDIEPQFVDSKDFCATSRKRGCIHNLSLENRSPLHPIAPKTIQEAFPFTKCWWPSWDPRKQLNTIQTFDAGKKVGQEICEILRKSSDPPPPETRKYVLRMCSKWNLIWTGLNKATPLELREMEFLLGFPEDHTRCVPVKKRYEALGSAFQVDTLAYHLSVLKGMYPQGIKVLSLFSGIGGAEVALDRLGIHMKTVISVEKCEVRRSILRSWWEQTQSGTLIQINDVSSHELIENEVRKLGGVDLVIGASPWTDLTTKGLEGELSSLFYHYVRILKSVRAIRQ